LDVEPFATETIVDVAGTSYEVVKVLLAAYPAIESNSKTLEMIERAKGLSNFKYGGDTGFRLIQDNRILPMLTQGYYAIGDYEEALKYSTLALKDAESFGFFESAFFSTMTVVSSTLSNGKNADGEFYTFEDALFAARLQPRVIRARSELELGKYKEAQAGFDEVLSSKLITGITSMYYPVLHDRGRVAEALGDDESAARYYRESIDAIENSRVSIKIDSNKIAYVGNKQEVYASLVRVLYKQHKITEAFEVAENSKARALVDLLASKGNSGTDGVDLTSVTTDSAKGFNNLQAEIDSKGIAETSNTRSVDRGLLLKARTKLNSEAPEYASLVTVNSTDKTDYIISICNLTKRRFTSG